jgi:hypothetical protein
MPRAKIEDEMLAIMAEGCNDRDRDLIAACLVWRTNRRPTYRSVGKRFGVTSERVRQVFGRWLKAWAEKPPFAPTLDRALALVQVRSPTCAAEVERQLAAGRLSKEPLALERLYDLAALMGRKPAFVILGTGSQRSVAMQHDARLIVQLQRRARKLVVLGGVATVRQLNGPWLADPRLPQCLTQALRSLKDLAWLDETHEVFSLLRTKRNKLWTRIRKVLAVAPKIDVDVLLEAISRDNRFSSVSSSHLLAFCRRHPACRVVRKAVIARDPGNPLDVLRGHERTLVRYLIEHGSTPRRELFEFARENGIGRPSFNVCLNSPPITRYARGLYGVTGGFNSLRT